MKKIAFLSCDDLTDFVVDDNLLYEELKSNHPEITFDVRSWSDPSVDWSNYQFAILRTTWDYTKKIKLFLETMEHIQNSGCQLLNPLSVIYWNSHKTYLKELSEKDIPVIESYFLQYESLDALNKTLLDSKKYVLKPVVGASADQIQILSKSEILNFVSKLKSKSEDQLSQWFIQPFIEEVFLGEKSLFYVHSKFSHAVKKVPKQGDFRVQEEHGGLITPYQPLSEELAFAQQVLKALDPNLLYARIDFLQTSNGPKLIELELIEPSFYFRTDPKSVTNFIEGLKELVTNN